MYKIVFKTNTYKRIIYAANEKELEKVIHYALKVGYLVQNVEKLESGEEADSFIKEVIAKHGKEVLRKGKSDDELKKDNEKPSRPTIGKPLGRV